MTTLQSLGEGATVVPVSDASMRRAWRQAAMLAFIAALGLLAIFWSTLSATVNTWSGDRAFNHAFLVPLISAYLIWERRQLLRQVAPRPTALGLVAVVAGAAGWLLGEAAGVLIVQQFAIVVIILGMALGLFGWQVSRRMAFPLLYLVFAVPFGTFLVPWLQDVTAEFVVRGLRIIGIPVFLDGVFITIPNGRFEVAVACAGLRFLIASLALGALFANIMYRSWWRRGAFIFLSLTVPIVANGFRALGIVLLAYYSNNELAVGVDHIVYGWVFFSFVTIMLLLLGATFRDGGVQHVFDGSAVAVRPGRLAGMLAMMLVGLSLAWAAPLYAAYGERRAATAAPATAVGAFRAPVVAADWRLLPEDADGWRPTIAGADHQAAFAFQRDGHTVRLAIGYFNYQRQGAEAVGHGNTMEVDPWQRAGGGAVAGGIAGLPATVNYTRLVSSAGGRVVWHWYWVDGRFTGDAYWAKLLQMRARLLGGNEAAALIAVAADYGESPAEAADRIRHFLDAVEPLDGYLRHPQAN